MILDVIVAGPLENNVYLLVDEDSREALVIDTALGHREVIERLTELQAKLKYILNTHGHYDHTAGNAPLQEASGAKIAIHEEDAYRLEKDASEALLYMPSKPLPSKADILLHEGDELILGSTTLEVLHTPGHTEGSSCFYVKTEKVLFTGDTLFAGTCGRTDLQGGDSSKMIESLTRLSCLHLDIKVYPGHGLPTTIRDEAWLRNTALLRNILEP